MGVGALEKSLPEREGAEFASPFASPCKRRCKRSLQGRGRFAFGKISFWEGIGSDLLGDPPQLCSVQAVGNPVCIAQLCLGGAL